MKVEIFQGLNQEIHQLCTEEDIMEENEAADLFQNKVKFVIAWLDAVFPVISSLKMEPISSNSDDPTSEKGQIYVIWI